MTGLAGRKQFLVLEVIELGSAHLLCNQAIPGKGESQGHCGDE